MAEVVDLVYEKSPVNLEGLNEELAAAMGEKFAGVSAGPSGLRVHIQDDMPQSAQEQIGALVAAHDATKLTAAQQAEVNREAALDALRKPWADWTAQDQTDFLRVLAEQAGLIPVA
jgi:hypothetical protein